MKDIQDLGYGISLIDVFDLKKEQRTGTYVIREDDITIVETSASPSIPYLLKGLESLSIHPSEIKNIIVTHIHLDHAGGTGLFLKDCPNAKVIVHPKGKRHLANPSRLIEGARAVYGNQFDELFDPIVPIPEERLVAMEDEQTLQIGKDRTLQFLHTPGHANHHLSIYDAASNGIFTGDTIGVYYPQLLSQELEFYLPSTSPNQFNPDAMLASAERMEKLELERIYFGHYGKSENPHHVFTQLRKWLPLFLETAKLSIKLHTDSSFEQKATAISTDLFNKVQAYLKSKQINLTPDVQEIIQLDLSVCAMGLVDYLSKKQVNA
ncbi:MBL fold metallo-hydrolase [Metabacillus iocasae]|uniref:Glyoxylase-like metal-dependent hydrolase (Beta-lactamase superfamily II) n=1 Tax=Priestia iocasae TaxID=2291674 RepID=A0ABS2QWA6_9BACI|nr:MBL fold metallo-hydrolase [Metabacillus iocasae]MBM7703754.1 glyoxylase-like metal-dependent hydrolase (beta-lactamase superfamily II) [Metabacillus iocasae]